MTSDEEWANTLKPLYLAKDRRECLYAWADWAEERGRKDAAGLRILGEELRDPRGLPTDVTLKNPDRNCVWYSREYYSRCNDQTWFLPKEVWIRLKGASMKDEDCYKEYTSFLKAILAAARAYS